MSSESTRPSPLNDPDRLDLLRTSGLLDVDRIEVFERLARAAGYALRISTAQVNLITEDQQIPRTCSGSDPSLTIGPVSLEYSYCRHVVASSEPLVVSDTRKHPLTRDSRATTELGLRTYAGVPLTVHGQTLGTLCVVDFEPREWSDLDVKVLNELAAVAVAEIEDRLRERRIAQEALKENQLRYRTLTDVDPDAILEMDENSIILSVNPSVERIFGYRPEELVGKSLSILIPEHLREAHRRGMERYLATGERNVRWEGIELPALTKSGREIETEISFGEYLIEGRHIFAGFIRDITQRKNAERLRGAEHQATRVLSESHSLETAAPRVLQAIGEGLGWNVGALWVVDSKAGLLRLKSLWHADATKVAKFEAASRQSTFSRGQGLPGEVWERQAPEWIVDVQGHANFPRAQVASKEGLHSAFAFPVRSGNEFLGVIEFFNYQIQEPDEALLRMVEAIGIEVGQSIKRVQAEEERDRALADLARLNVDLQRANERLSERTVEAEAASQAKSDFVATMSHELRTPLNAVIGYSNLLMEGVPEPLPDAAVKQVRRIGVSAKHLLELIEEILTFARVESGREDMNITPVKPAELLDEVESIIEPRVRHKGLELRVESPDPEWVIRTDAGKVRQILLHLLENAVKFTDEGEIEVSVDCEGDEVVYSVRDTGIGIKPEHQAKIFEPFWQVEQTTTRSAEGQGMGLTVSQRLAQLMGGEVQVQSTPGKGSVFQLRLPDGAEPPSPDQD